MLACFSHFKAQYYSSAAISTIDASKTGVEGDFYLDTLNDNLRVGLANGKLGWVTDNQNVDSLVLRNDSLIIYLESANPKGVSLSSLNGGASQTVGDIKTGIQTADHNGWYLLDGRLLITLSLAVQARAATLGITGALPNASNRVPKTIEGAEALLDQGGATTRIITQANLPSYSITGTSSTAGAHTHTGSVSTDGEHSHSANQQNLGLNKQGFTSSGSNKDSIVIIGGSSPLTFDDAGLHTHNVTLSASGNHTHTVTIPSGGGGTPISLYQPYMVVNRFIYLGP